jgi:DNA polymerase-3 subunit delta
MPAKSTKTAHKSLHLIGGTDEFSIKEAAAALAKSLAPKNAGEFGVEIIEGNAQNADDVIQIVQKLRESLQTFGFFGDKLVWLKDTNLLGTEPVTQSQAASDALDDFAALLKEGLPAGVTLLVSAIGLDQRRALFKIFQNVGDVQIFSAPERGKRQSDEQIAAFLARELRKLGKKMDADARETFLEMVEPDFRLMDSELQKLALFTGKRETITEPDVRAICSATRASAIWDLTDSLGERNLPKSLNALRNLLFHGENAMGVVAMLAGQFRLMLLARDLMERRVLNVRDDTYITFKTTFERLGERDTSHFPRDKSGNLPNPWRFHRCALAAKKFSVPELVRALELLLDAQRKIVATQLDESLVLEETLAKIVRK